MTLSPDMQVVRHRSVMVCLGGLAALALWALARNWDDPAMAPPLYLALFTFVGAYSSVTLALAGPVPVTQALKGALMIALPVAVLVSLAGLRQVVATDLLDEPVMLSVIIVMVFFSTPFLLVWVQHKADWRNYAILFDAAWTMTVRYGVAYVFVGVFWLVVFLSNALLNLVGVDIIDRLLAVDWAPFALSGAVLGLGLAVVYELREKISPFLILHLLRLLVPVVLVVLAVFLGAVPFRGLSDLFGEFSAAATLMGAAIVAITLISTALDRDDTRAVNTRGIRAATRALALLLPLLSLLAVWAVVLRVRQYGWTPDRVLAMASALFVLAYGVGYGIAVLRGDGWAARVRNVNVAMALTIIGASALWMTPLLNPYRISTNSQVARFEAGAATLDQLPIWDLQHAWGKSGQKGLAQLESQTERPDHDELVARIKAGRSQSSRYQFNRMIEDRQTPGTAKSLARLIAVRPVGADLPEGMFADIPFYRITRWLNGCNHALPDGRPGCVLIQGDFTRTRDAGLQAMVLYLDDRGQAQANFLLLRDGEQTVVRDVFDQQAERWSFLSIDAVARALDGAFDIRPSGSNALYLGDVVLVPQN